MNFYLSYLYTKSQQLANSMQGLLIRARLKPQSCGHFLRLGGKCKQTYASTGSYNPATVTVWVTLGGRLFMFTPQTQKVYRTATNLRFQPSSIHKPWFFSYNYFSGIFQSGGGHKGVEKNQQKTRHASFFRSPLLRGRKVKPWWSAEVTHPKKRKCAI